MKRILLTILTLPIIFFSPINSKIADKEHIENLIHNKTPNENEDNCLNSQAINNINTDHLSNERKFVLGKCNPVLFIAGFLGTRLTASVNCINLITDISKLYELRYFCGSSVCKQAFFGSYEVEEYTLWPALFNNPFKLLQDHGNKDNSCFAYFMRHFNSENECPMYNETNKNICLHNKNIKVTFFGDTSQTTDKSECGTRSICRIVDGGYSVIPDYFVNSPAAQGFYNMIQGLKTKGYSTGFSIAGLPYDFRKFHLTNEHFKEKFEMLVEMLYKNTGKKVIVIAHSLGNLNVLRILNKENFINEKIKRYIGIVPPFFGSAKVVEYFSDGSEEFRMKLFLSEYIDISQQAQKFYAIFSPVTYALLLKPKLHMLSKNKEYKPFIDAIKERIDLEKNCGILSKNFGKNCTEEYIEKNSKLFSEYFSFFPKFNSEFCKNLREKILEKLHTHDFITKKNSARENIYEFLPNYEGCEIRIYDFLRCPFLKILQENETDFTHEDFNSKCFSDMDDTTQENLIFNHDCTEKNSKNCLIDYFKNHTSFDVKNFFKTRDPEYKDFPNDLFLSREEYSRTIEIMSQRADALDSEKELVSPNVPTSIIYASFLDTKNNYIIKQNKTHSGFSRKDINFHSGDGTVGTYSSLVPVMKWIYENKKNNKTNEIQIVNYCSYLSNYKEYAFDFTEEAKKKEYVALGCECLNSEGYDMYKISKNIDKCSHSSMISDNNVIKYVYSMGSDEKTYDKLQNYSKDQFKAFNNALHLDYENICNQLLHE